jgi:hypothetical protein
MAELATTMERRRAALAADLAALSAAKATAPVSTSRAVPYFLDTKA